MLPLLGDNHCLTLLHMANRFIWLEEKGEHINEFAIGYIINPSLHVNKAFKEQVEKCMNNSFGELTQLFIKTTLLKKTSVLALIIFHETRVENPRKDIIVLSCAIYITIENYVCIDDLACKFF